VNDSLFLVMKWVTLYKSTPTVVLSGKKHSAQWELLPLFWLKDWNERVRAIITVPHLLRNEAQIVSFKKSHCLMTDKLWNRFEQNVFMVRLSDDDDMWKQVERDGSRIRRRTSGIGNRFRRQRHERRLESISTNSRTFAKILPTHQSLVILVKRKAIIPKHCYQ